MRADRRRFGPRLRVAKLAMLAVSPQMTKARASSWSKPRAFSAAARARTPAHCLYACDARRCPVPHGSCMTVLDEANRQSHRLFHCAACGQAVHIYRACDRGNVYCAGACAPMRRTESLRRAGARYQRSHRGATRHAVRQSAWRGRQMQEVTHQGSLAVTLTGTLPGSATEATRPLEHGDARHSESRSGSGAMCAALSIRAPSAARACDHGHRLAPRTAAFACSFCRRRLTPWVRMGPLRHAH